MQKCQYPNHRLVHRDSRKLGPEQRITVKRALFNCLLLLGNFTTMLQNLGIFIGYGEFSLHNK